MNSLELSKEETDALIDVLESYLSDLRMEMADTDSSFFRDELRTKKEVLDNILDRLRNLGA
jgi:hypothetical protein